MDYYAKLISDARARARAAAKDDEDMTVAEMVAALKKAAAEGDPEAIAALESLRREARKEARAQSPEIRRLVQQAIAEHEKSRQAKGVSRMSSRADELDRAFGLNANKSAVRHEGNRMSMSAIGKVEQK